MKKKIIFGLFILFKRFVKEVFDEFRVKTMSHVFFISFYVKFHRPSDRIKMLILKDKRKCFKVKIYETVLHQKTLQHKITVQFRIELMVNLLTT